MPLYGYIKIDLSIHQSKKTFGFFLVFLVIPNKADMSIRVEVSEWMSVQFI